MQNVIVDQIFEPGRRVTVAMGTDRNLDSGNKLIFACLFYLVLLKMFDDLFLMKIVLYSAILSVCANLTVVLIVIMPYPCSSNVLLSHVSQIKISFSS